MSWFLIQDALGREAVAGQGRGREGRGTDDHGLIIIRGSTHNKLMVTVFSTNEHIVLLVLIILE